MRMIDAHFHVYKFKEHYSEQAAKKWVDEASYPVSGPPIHWATGKKLRPTDYDAPYDWAVEVMDNAGVEQAFLLGSWVTPEDIKVPTEYLAEALKKYPDRFYGFCCPDPLGGSKSVEELEWAITEKGFTGLKFLPSYNHVHPFDRKLWPIYEKASSLEVPIIIHTGWGSMSQNKMAWQDPYVLEDLLIKCPEINISFGHTGFHRVYDVLMMMRSHKNLYGDFSYWGMFPVDFTARVLVFAKKINVFDRLMWGSDFPYASPRSEAEGYERVTEYIKKHDLEPMITNKDLVQFFSENALRFVKKGHS